MSEIKPSEVTAILRQQLHNFDSKTELEETGTVLLVGDGIARVYGLQNAVPGSWSYLKSQTAPSWESSSIWKKIMWEWYC
jgi:F0F1-type ATP synthase alpha subunit